jgi:hypothetical protein
MLLKKWLNDDEDDELPLLIDRDENSVGFSFRRKHDRLLAEFGWSIIPFIFMFF